MNGIHRPPSDMAPASLEPPPPPGAALRAALADMEPVRTRRPGWTALVLAAAGAAIVLAVVAWRGARPDLFALPRGWVVAIALAWAMGALAMLLPAVLPRRGEVLPDSGRAGRIAMLVTLSLLAVGLFATVDAAGATVVPERTWGGFGRAWWHCTRNSLLMALPFLILGGALVRGLFPSGGARVAAALGAAGGAIAGLTLHLICPIGGGLHVGLAHAGGVVLGALVGMALLPRVLRS